MANMKTTLLLITVGISLCLSPTLPSQNNDNWLHLAGTSVHS